MPKYRVKDLADYLELTEEQTKALDIELEAETDEFDTIIYSYLFYVPDDTPLEILEKKGWNPGDIIDEIPVEIVYDDYIDWIRKFSQSLHVFQSSVLDVESMLEVEVGSQNSDKYYQLLYANLISVLEAYLSDVFINKVLSNPKYIRAMFERTEVFSNDTMKVRDLYRMFEEKEIKVTNYLKGLVWHNLDTASKLFKGVLGVVLVGDLKFIKKAIEQRHDIVHRNGRTKKDVGISIQKRDVSVLIGKIKELVENIEHSTMKL